MARGMQMQNVRSVSSAISFQIPPIPQTSAPRANHDPLYTRSSAVLVSVGPSSMMNPSSSSVLERTTLPMPSMQVQGGQIAGAFAVSVSQMPIVPVNFRAGADGQVATSTQGPVST